MARWLGRLFRGPSSREDLLPLQSELARLRLDLEERERELAKLRRDAEGGCQRGEILLQEGIKAKMERLFSMLANAVSQLQTQRYILEIEGKPLAAVEIMAVAQGIVAVMVEEGLALEGEVGERVAYDPARHQSLGGALEPGESVRLAFVGLSYGGRILRKAGVERI